MEREGGGEDGQGGWEASSRLLGHGQGWIPDVLKPKRGRPPLDPGKARECYLRIRLQPGELEALKAHAKREGRSVSDVARAALKRATSR